ncbi:hypothetical protein I4U23_016389 [Adineta vaga]|nr:hypothetical protein I4U23_016389 [Adineta vaga]
MLLFASLLIFALIQSTIPCSCITLSIDVEFAQTSIIFIGRVVHTNIKDQNSIFGYAEMTMEVQESIKGTKVGEKIIVRSDLEESICGLGVIPVGSQWQIWLTMDNLIHLCSRSTYDAYKDIDILRNLALRERIYDENQSNRENNSKNISDENSSEEYDNENDSKEINNKVSSQIFSGEYIKIDNENVNIGSIFKIDLFLKIFCLILYFFES